MRQQLIVFYTCLVMLQQDQGHRWRVWESDDRRMPGTSTSKVFAMPPGDAPPAAPPAEDGAAAAPAGDGATPPPENESESPPAPAPTVAKGRVRREGSYTLRLLALWRIRTEHLWGSTRCCRQDRERRNCLTVNQGFQKNFTYPYLPRHSLTCPVQGYPRISQQKKFMLGYPPIIILVSYISQDTKD